MADNELDPELMTDQEICEVVLDDLAAWLGSELPAGAAWLAAERERFSRESSPGRVSPAGGDQ
jgi:hypothetical protein